MIMGFPQLGPHKFGLPSLSKCVDNLSAMREVNLWQGKLLMTHSLENESVFFCEFTCCLSHTFLFEPNQNEPN